MPALKKSDLFVVAITNNLTDIKHKVLNFLYSPIVSVSSIQLYMALYSCVGLGAFESNANPHQDLLETLAINPQDFILMRENLEGIGLLDTYYQQGVYLYLLKEPLHPYEFFKNEQLAHLLMVKLGKSSFEKLVQELSTYKYDINQFAKITKSFDEVYGLVPLKNKNEFSNFWASANNDGVVLKNRHFDFDQLDIRLRAREILSEEIIKTDKFYHEINALSFFYGFCERDLEDIIIRSIDENHDLNYEELSRHAKMYYDRRDLPLVIKRKEPGTLKSENQIINTLNTISPNDYMYHKYGTYLTSPEIEMLKLLQDKTQLPNGVINVLLSYVTAEKEGEIPSYNYFLKIANTWKRVGIVTTEDAYRHINKTVEKNQGTAKKVTKVPDWYQNYMKDMDEKVKTSKSQYEGLTLEDVLKDYEEKK